MAKQLGRPPRQDKNNKSVGSSEKGTKPGEMRKTYIVNIDTANKIDAIAAKRSVNVKDVVNEFLSYMVTQYEKMHGPIQ